MAPDTAAARIIRWIVPVDDQPHDYAMNGAILHVASRNPSTVEFWTLDSGGPTRPRIFQVVGTGHPYPAEWKHIGTALAADGAAGLAPDGVAMTEPTTAARRIPVGTRAFTIAESCGDPQCRQFDHRCPGCGNDLHGDNFCMVSACEQEV